MVILRTHLDALCGPSRSLDRRFRDNSLAKFFCEDHSNCGVSSRWSSQGFLIRAHKTMEVVENLQGSNGRPFLAVRIYKLCPVIFCLI